VAPETDTMKVCISYARGDDLFDKMDADCGWVTALLERLKTSFAKKLGREGLFELWRDDEQLKSQDQISRSRAPGISKR
jgi:hypothetical protein